MIGLAVVFAGFVGIFATYLYLQAKANVMETQLELTQAKITFYKGMFEAGEQMSNMVNDMEATVAVFNERAAQANISVGQMDKYENQMRRAMEEIEALRDRHMKLKEGKPAEHPVKNAVPTESKPFPVMAPPPPEEEKPAGNVFQIAPDIKQQIQQRKYK
jgi:hypothetical protein